jgi:dTDP-4-amino-4,6-dideoxygalactose transaminase
MKIKLVDLEKQSLVIENEVWPRIRQLVGKSEFIGSKYLEPFEQAFATFIGSPYFSGVANGTIALEIALRAAGIKPEQEVITVSHTFFATIEAILNIGAKPVFVDVESDSGYRIGEFACD